jgi:hypothetical protein
MFQLYFSDHHYKNWFTNRVKGVRPLLTNSGYKITVKSIFIICENGISNIKINRWSMLLGFAGKFKCFELKKQIKNM